MFSGKISPVAISMKIFIPETTSGSSRIKRFKWEKRIKAAELTYVNRGKI
jgi:hypothetical protein